MLPSVAIFKKASMSILRLILKLFRFYTCNFFMRVYFPKKDKSIIPDLFI